MNLEIHEICLHRNHSYCMNICFAQWGKIKKWIQQFYCTTWISKCLNSVIAVIPIPHVCAVHAHENIHIHIHKKNTYINWFAFATHFYLYLFIRSTLQRHPHWSRNEFGFEYRIILHWNFWFENRVVRQLEEHSTKEVLLHLFTEGDVNVLQMLDTHNYSIFDQSKF